MEGVLEKMSSAQILAAIAILTGGVVLLTMIVTIYRYQVRALADDTTLRREQQQGELALRNRIVEKGGAAGANLDELLAATHPVTDDLNTKLATRFGMLNLDADEIGSTLQLALAADPTRKQAIVAVMDELIEFGSEPEAIIAAVRPLCPSPAPAGC
jgi:hypothetical protein